MLAEPEIALAASPREWGQRLHRHVADHGGARVRATVLHPADALAEDFDVFVADDTTSFLTARLVDRLHEQGRQVLGVYDPDDSRGKGELVELGVDDAIARDADAGDFLACVSTLAAVARPARHGDGELSTQESTATATVPVTDEPSASGPTERGQITAVAAASGGTGATEIAIGLAVAAAGRGEPTVLVDADEVAPCLAQRLGLPLYPNLRAAIDAVEHHDGGLEETVDAVEQAGFSVLPGLSCPDDWPELRPYEVTGVVDELARGYTHVIVNVGARLEPLRGGSGAERHAVSRTLLARADRVVGVGAPTPVGVTRLLSWIDQLHSLAAETPLHLALNRAPRGGFKRGELADELDAAELGPPQGGPVRFLPTDARVEAAAWAGEPPLGGPFVKACSQLAADVLAAGASEAAPRRRGLVGLR
jgi:MinD-like ATPase involved in chromosome partitioning or flagellar assembly